MKGPYARARLSGAKIPRVAPGSVKTATGQAPSASDCPRCQTKLTDPDGLGLCPRCGFCRSLDEAQKSPATYKPTAVEAAAPTIVASCRAMRQLPESVWLVLLVTLCLLPVCYCADRSLAPGSSERVLWTVGQVLIGLITIFISQVWAFNLLRRQNEPLGFVDVIFPARLWRRTFLGLPETGGPIALCGSGGAAVFTAIFWIGGWSWWFQGDTAPDRPTTAAAKVEGRDWRNQYQRLKAAAATVTNGEKDKASAKSTTTRNSTISDSRPTTQCAVIGYILGDDGRSIAGLVLATLRDGKLSYAGTVRNGVGKEETPRLMKKLAALGSNAPLLNDLDVKAIWVRPELFCEVHQSGYDDKGQLVEPRFKALIEE